MGEHFFRELDMEDAVIASIEAVEWGFPRAITREEVRNGIWFRIGGDAIFWYERTTSPEDFGMHIVVKPTARYSWGAKRWIGAYGPIAELLGAKRLHFQQIEAEDSQVAGYLRRLGWEPSDIGLIKHLGG